MGRLGSGALPPPTARPLGGLPGPTTHWLWVWGVRAWGPVTNPIARALASWLCALWGRHEGARGGRLLPWCGASGVGRSPTPDCPPSGRAAGAHYPLAVGAGGCGRGGRALLGTFSRAAVCRVLCALPGFAAPGGRCGLAPVLVPWLWPAACLSSVPCGPALVRGARGGRPRTGLIVPAAGPCRGKGAGRAPRRTRSGPRDGVVSGGSLRLRSWAACAAVVWRVWTRSLTRRVSRTVRLATGDSAGAPGLFSVDADTAPFRVGGRHARVPRVCACACPDWPGRAGRPPGRVLVRLTFPLAILGSLFACSAPSWLGLPRLWLLLGFFFVSFPLLPLVAPPLSLALRVFRPRVPWALASCCPAPPPFFFAPPPSLLSSAFPAFRLPLASAPPLAFFFFPLGLCVLWRCAAVWCCALVPCLLFLFFSLLVRWFPIVSLLVLGSGPVPGCFCFCALPVRCCAGVPASLLSVRCSLALSGLAGVLCCCRLCLCVCCWAWLSSVVSWWVLVAPGVVSRWRAVVCPWVLCCAVLLRVVPPGVALLCAVLFRCALFGAAARCVLGRCPLSWGPVPSGAVFCLVTPRCVCFAVVCRRVVLFAVVLCAVCALGRRVVRFLSSPLCAVLLCGPLSLCALLPCAVPPGAVLPRAAVVS